MQRHRTRAGILAVLTLGVALVGCRGSDDDDATDEVATQESPPSAGADTAGADTASADTASADTAAADTASADTTGAGTASADTASGDTAGGATTGGSAAGSAAGSGDVVMAPEVECPDSEQGLSDTEVVLGGTYPLSGPVAAYASIPKGIDAYFQHINEQNGGVAFGDGVTREITWNFLDDQYTPDKTLENVRRLIENDGAWFIFNPLGTPPNTAIRDYMNESEVPQMYVATGASKWGNEHEEFPWTIGYQPDYESEGIAYAQYILGENPEAQIGILYANDDFGKDYLNGLREGLGDSADQLVSEVTYETTDATIDSQVSQVVDSGVDTFVLIATPTFAIQGINRLQAIGFEGQKILTSVSSSVGAVMGQVQDGAAEGFVTSVYLKDPSSPEYDEDPAMQEAKEILLAAYPDANVDDGFYFYGISVAQLLERTFQSMPTTCRAALMAAAENLSWEDPPLTLEGIGIETGDGDYFPLQQVQLERWEGDGWVKFGDIIDASDIQD